MDLVINSGSLAELAGMTTNRLTRWVDAGILTPAVGGTDKGDPRGWSFMQALGIVHGMALTRPVTMNGRETGWKVDGRSPEEGLAMVVARYLGRMGEEELLAAFNEGRTFLVPSGTPQLIPPPPGKGAVPPQYDLKAAYDALKAAWPTLARNAAEKPLVAQG